MTVVADRCAGQVMVEVFDRDGWKGIRFSRANDFALLMFSCVELAQSSFALTTFA